MSSSFVGSIVSLDCGETLGTYQGHVKCIDSSTQTLTITKAYRNGVPCEVPEITIIAGDILELKILKNPVEANSVLTVKATPSKLSPENDDLENTCPSPVKVCDIQANGVELNSYGQPINGYKYSSQNKDMKGHVESLNGYHQNGSARYTPTNSYARNKSSPTYGNDSPRFTNGNNSPRYGNNNGNCRGQRYTPTNENGTKNVRFTPTRDESTSMRPRRNSTSDMKNKKSTTPRKIEFNTRRAPPKEDCFSAPSDSYLQEFDFEKNLALFDKKAVFEEIENTCPETVKVVENKRPQKYRCDENVLQAEPIVLQQIKVPNDSSTQFVTDSGLVIPTITYELRSRLFSMAAKYGFTMERQSEMVGRSASEMVLQLLGGSHRLNPKNGHQLPTVVVLCGPHTQGAQGVNCARQLANHNVRTHVFVPNVTGVQILQDELNLFSLCDGKRASNLQDLPTGPVDVIINAMDNHENLYLQQQTWYKTLEKWANEHRAPILALDPPAHEVPIKAKWCLSICLPLNVKVSASQLYLSDLGFPKKVFSEVGIKYVSPFNHKFVIPLHIRS